MCDNDIRAIVHERAAGVIATFDAHNAGIQEWTTPHTYACPDPCTFRGDESQWQQHVADQLCAALTIVTVELP